MKNLSFLFLSIAVLCTGPSFADTSAAPAAGHPCKKIHQACLAAGYTKGGHKTGKGLAADCMKPVMNGQAVAGVTVDPNDVAACHAKHGAKH